jgi:NAD(P)-dependent dehydrogenase (short-subunit alcohol dehydrogenase family)
MTQKIALVTAAGSGMGAACARRLAQDGWQVAILSSSGKGEALARELGGVGVTGSNLEPADLQRLVDAAMDRWGRIDAVVNSAGHGPTGPLLEITDAQWHAAMDIFLLNVVRIARMVTPVMQAQGGGCFVNISSAWAGEPTTMFPTSGVVRAGLSAFAKMFADSYAAQNIRMNTVLPGWIDSRPWRRPPPDRADAALRHRRGCRGRGGLAGVGRCRLCHRPGDPRGWRVDARALRPAYSASTSLPPSRAREQQLIMRRPSARSPLLSTRSR